MDKIGLKGWDELPEFMRVEEVRSYWEILHRKQGQLIAKRLFDVIVAWGLLLLLIIPMMIIAAWIRVDSEGPVFFRQERVTRYGKTFHIHKFRTMVSNADKLGTAVTVEGDGRITRVGKVLRKYRLDELPQIFDVIQGTMSFVGTRPEVVKYVNEYSKVYYATLLMPAGITSEASIRYKNEDKLLNKADDVDRVYINQVIPEKMKWNLNAIENFSFVKEILTISRTMFAILGREYE